MPWKSLQGLRDPFPMGHSLRPPPFGYNQLYVLVAKFPHSALLGLQQEPEEPPPSLTKGRVGKLCLSLQKKDLDPNKTNQLGTCLVGIMQGALEKFLIRVLLLSVASPATPHKHCICEHFRPNHSPYTRRMDVSSPANRISDDPPVFHPIPSAATPGASMHDLLLPVQEVLMVYLCLSPTQVGGINKGMGRTREQRILVMVVVMVICFLLCWLPYATVALIATFGKPGLITPAASVIPSILAKSSTVYNPIIYVFLNKQFYRRFWALLRCKKATVNSSSKSSSRSCHALQRAQGDASPAAAASARQPCGESPDPAGNAHPPPEGTPTAKRAVLVAHYGGPTPRPAAAFGEFESRRESFAK
ncbi:uncharacterized protein ACIBXB_021959 [Morphnus guianensis]